MVGGWVLKMKLMLTQLSTKLELKLKLSWIAVSDSLSKLSKKVLDSLIYIGQ